MAFVSVRLREEEAFPRETVSGPAPHERQGVLREEWVIARCDALIDLAAALFQVSSKELRHTAKTSRAVTRVRQIAMYVAHVVLEMSMQEVGRGFSRDRTTVMHACHLIEDLRDDAEFDRVVGMVERVVSAAFQDREID